MRHIPASLAVVCLCLAPAMAANAAEFTPGQNAAANIPANAPASADVLEYIRLFGYRQMLEAGAERQLASIIEIVRQTRENVAPGVLELIHEELRAELKEAARQAVHEMVAVFQRHLTREDVAYLISIGRDPRMQKVVRLQPRIAADMEGIGEKLAEGITAKAAPRIEQRLKKLEDGQQL